MRTNQLELVGQKIRHLRRERKLTQTDLAGKIGIHQSDLSRMEKGEYRVGLDTLLKLLQEFDLSIGDFFEERPRSASIVDRYNTLSEEAKKEVDSFIEFKHQQDTSEWDGEEGEQ
jgi:transcriptional regulator with XRE-family HTH domain